MPKLAGPEEYLRRAKRVSHTTKKVFGDVERLTGGTRTGGTVSEDLDRFRIFVRFDELQRFPVIAGSLLPARNWCARERVISDGRVWHFHPTR